MSSSTLALTLNSDSGLNSGSEPDPEQQNSLQFYTGHSAVGYQVKSMNSSTMLLITRGNFWLVSVAKS